MCQLLVIPDKRRFSSGYKRRCAARQKKCKCLRMINTSTVPLKWHNLYVPIKHSMYTIRCLICPRRREEEKKTWRIQQKSVATWTAAYRTSKKTNNTQRKTSSIGFHILGVCAFIHLKNPFRQYSIILDSIVINIYAHFIILLLLHCGFNSYFPRHL